VQRITDQRELDAVAQRAARGDRYSFGLLCAAIETDIWRYCRSVLRDHTSAEDATQETFARIVTAIRRYRGDAPVRVWALVIARRVCSDTIRQRDRHNLIVDGRPHDRHHPSSSIHRGRLTDAEQTSLLDQLDNDDRTAFVLTQLLGFSYADTADITAVPVGTVRSRIHRARNRLAALWTEADEPADTQSSPRHTRPESSSS
jgi:RNA polymerase sigma-70 factor (ECF subfamily)